jgi:putative ABC transport system permease protein
LGITAGDTVIVEALEGQRPVRELTVVDFVDDVLGLSAYLDIDALHQMLRESDVLSGAALLVDSMEEARLSRELKLLPAVAGASFKSAVIRNFREILTANMNLSIVLNVIFAGIIAFGVVYNAARVSLSERNRELASLRVLGFTRAEISFILLGELAVVTVAALPVGGLLGYGLARLIVQTLNSEVYRFPLVFSRDAVAWAFLTIVAAVSSSGFWRSRCGPIRSRSISRRRCAGHFRLRSTMREKRVFANGSRCRRRSPDGSNESSSSRATWWSAARRCSPG